MARAWQAAARHVMAGRPRAARRAYDLQAECIGAIPVMRHSGRVVDIFRSQ